MRAGIGLPSRIAGLKTSFFAAASAASSNSGPADVVTVAASTAPLAAMVSESMTDAFSAAAFFDSGYSGVAPCVSSGGTRPDGADGAPAASCAKASGSGAAKVARRNPMTKVRPAWALMSGPFRKPPRHDRDPRFAGEIWPLEECPRSVRPDKCPRTPDSHRAASRRPDTRDRACFLTAFATLARLASVARELLKGSSVSHRSRSSLMDIVSQGKTLMLALGASKIMYLMLGLSVLSVGDHPRARLVLLPHLGRPREARASARRVPRSR